MTVAIDRPLQIHNFLMIFQMVKKLVFFINHKNLKICYFQKCMMEMSQQSSLSFQK